MKTTIYWTLAVMYTKRDQLVIPLDLYLLCEASRIEMMRKMLLDAGLDVYK